MECIQTDCPFRHPNRLRNNRFIFECFCYDLLFNQCGENILKYYQGVFLIEVIHFWFGEIVQGDDQFSEVNFVAWYWLLTFFERPETFGPINRVRYPFQYDTPKLTTFSTLDAFP